MENRRPVQEMGDQEAAVADMVQILKDKPELLAPLVQHVWQMNQEKAADSRKRNIPQKITTPLLAMACGSFSGAKFMFVFLFTALSDIVKIQAETPEKHRGEFEEMKRSFGEVEMKQKKVEHDYAKMEEKVQSAIEDGHKISNADHKGLEVGLVTARCGLESCGDILSYLRKISDRLQQAAKEAMKSAKHVITGMVFAAALAAGFLYHWAVPSNYDDSDDDVAEKAPKQTSFIVAAGCLMVVAMVVHCKAMAQSYFNNQKLLADCEKFQKNELEKAQLFQTDMKRKIEDKLPSWKKLLDVLDIDVSLYASLLQPRVKSE